MKSWLNSFHSSSKRMLISFFTEREHKRGCLESRNKLYFAVLNSENTLIMKLGVRLKASPDKRGAQKISPPGRTLDNDVQN